MRAATPLHRLLRSTLPSRVPRLSGVPLPRWTRRPFPPYRHLPGSTPHPHRDPAGHAVAVPEAPEGWSPDEWARLDAWLWGVDLFNHGYWWEAHEAFEALWHAAGRSGPRADFVQAAIHLAAACLNRRRGHEAAARRQAARAARGLEAAPAGTWMGVDAAALAAEVRAWREDPGADPPAIRLDLPPSGPVPDD